MGLVVAGSGPSSMVSQTSRSAVVKRVAVGISPRKFRHEQAQ